MVTLSRLPMWDHAKADNPLDVTVKSSKSLGRNFAPTWAMVMGHKSGVMPDEVYATKYIEKLNKLYWPPIIEELEKSNHITFLCYCKDNTFCHTYLLIAYLVKHFNNNFEKLS